MIAEHADAAMIWCASVDTPSIGSGLLIARNLVLTARHVVETKSGEKLGGLRVRLVSAGADSIRGSVVWTSDVEDLALVQLDTGSWTPTYAYKFVEIESSDPISSAMVTGFPKATRDEADRARDYTVYGVIRRDGPGQLSFSVPQADNPDQEAQWSGISGGAVFRQKIGKIREIFGAIQESRAEFKHGKLFVAALSVTSLDDPFKSLYEKTGLKLELFVSDGSLRQKAAKDYSFLSSLYDFASSPSRNQFSKLDFEIDATFCDNFDQLKQTVRNPETDRERIPPRGILPGAAGDYRSVRVYLQAPGGYGKSTFLKRLISAAIEDGFVVFYLNAGLAEGTIERPDWEDLVHLFQSCARHGGNFDRFRKASDDTFPVIVTVDGLNESVEEWSNVSRLLIQLVNNYPQASIIVADRMNANRFLPEGFKRATLLPVQVSRIADDQLRSLVEKTANNKLLSVPFFLDQFYRQRQPGEAADGFVNLGRADIIGRYVELYAKAHGAQSSPIIDRLADVAIEAYRGKSQQIEGNLLRKRLNETEIAQNVGAGILVEWSKDSFSFTHHLVHDYFAAWWLKRAGMNAWTRDNFDPATLDTQSFDALELASELLGDVAPDFVNAVYDWNYRAALDCILNLDAGLSGKPSPVPAEMKDAVFALRAEKMFDPFIHTRESAQTRALEFNSAVGIDYAAIKSISELLDEIFQRYQPKSAPFVDWKALFVLREATKTQWTAIQDSPLQGWTAASVFRRPEVLNDDLVSYLIALYHAVRRAHSNQYYPAIALRWRIVHVLGASNSQGAQALLEAVIPDEKENDWVRYGSVRSLVEQVSRMSTPEAARAHLVCIRDVLPSLRPVVRGEVREVAGLAETQPPWWPEVYGEVLKVGVASSETESERELWKGQINKLIDRKANI
jgi:hypothetical protein